MVTLKPTQSPSTPVDAAVCAPDGPPLRIKSTELLQQRREVEIDHEGRIYRLRLTHLNKLILTA